jgi:hypothetical protein
MDRQRPGPHEWLFKNYDDTGRSKGSEQVTQILADLIEPGGSTIHYEIPELINSIWTRGEKPQQKKGRSASLSYKGDGHSAVSTKAFSLSTTYKILSKILRSSQIQKTDGITVGHLC